jgi:hypothetical protein
MAEYEVRDMSGSAFKNRNRRNENDAAYTGTVKIKGEEFWVNVWVKKDKNDQPWFSYSFREKQPRQQSNAPAKTQSKHDIELDSDIPF